MADVYNDGQAPESSDLVEQAVMFPRKAADDDADENSGVLLVRGGDPRYQ